MSLDELYNMWYNGNRYDPNFILMCYCVLQQVVVTDARKHNQLCDGIRYAMEDWLYDNKQR